MMFELVRESDVPLVDQIVERISRHIQEGQLAAGTRLPSIRRLAAQVGASAFTVVDAYDRLVARGLIASRAGRGFYVAPRVAGTAVAVIEAMPDPGADALALLQAVIADPAHLIAAGSGRLPDSWMEELTTSAVLTRLARSRRPYLWATCPPRGLNELREQLTAKLQRQGIAAGVENLMTTVGASQAFDLLCRTLLVPGDAVLVEDPGYFVLFEQLRAHHLRLIPVPRRAHGPDLEALEEACRAHRPRAFFLQSLLHNPTGTSIDATCAHRLVSLAEQFGFTLIEDDIYGDLYEGPAVRLAQIDGFRHVVYVGSFTKLIGPAVRVGFIATHPAMAAQLVQRKVLAMLSGSTLPEAIVAQILDGGRYRRHVERVRARLARMRADSQRALRRAGIRFDDDDSAGMFLWGEVPPATDLDQLVRDARERAILLAKGALFSPDRANVARLRFNVAHSAAPELTQFLSEALAPALS
ncbi:MAG: PLP-dependent aminotransferase family protein [Steroidobacteraceae bacterium]